MGLHKGYYKNDLMVNILNNTPNIKGKWSAI